MVCDAVQINIFLSVFRHRAPHHVLPTTTAANDARKEIDSLLSFRCTGVQFQDLLHSIEQLLRNDGFVHIGNSDPAGFFNIPNFFDFVIDLLPPALHHRSSVDFIFQNPQHLNRLPLCMSASFEPTVIIQAAQPFVLAGSQHVLAVQLLGNRLCAHSFQFSAVNRADNICCILVYHQTVFVPFVFAVAVDCITADELTFAPFHVQLAAHLDGNIPAVGIVQQILERNYNAVRIAALGVRIVIVIVDGDEANPHHGKNLFQILSHLNVITTKSG